MKCNEMIDQHLQGACCQHYANLLLKRILRTSLQQFQLGGLAYTYDTRFNKSHQALLGQSLCLFI